MSLDERLLDIIDLAYQAALEPELWPEALQGVADCIDTRRAVLLHKTDGRESGLGSTRLDPAVPSAYFQDYKTINPIQAQINLGGRRRGAATDGHYVDKAELLRSDFYDRFMRPSDMHGFLMLPLDTSLTTLNVIRDKSEGDFGARELGIATALMRPLGSAYAMGRRVAGERRISNELRDLVERLAGAMFVVRRDGRIVYANRAGEEMIAAQDGLSAPARILSAGFQAQAGFAALIGQAASRDAQNRHGGAMPLPRPSGRRPLTALVTPARGETAARVPGGPMALVSVIDPQASPLAPGDQLRQLFGFTPAEARVAAEFASGLEPAAIAERLGLSLHTVRVQIARIRAKTDTSRQGEFIALVLRSLGGPAWPRED